MKKNINATSLETSNTVIKQVSITEREGKETIWLVIENKSIDRQYSIPIRAIDLAKLIDLKMISSTVDTWSTTHGAILKPLI